MIADVTREAVLAAIAECDRAGLDAFLSWHGFARGAYTLRYRGRRYPSKAIVGVAVGYELGGEPLGPGDFSGGAEHSARRLVHLGFTVEIGGQRLGLDDVAIPQRLGLRPTEAELRLYVCRPTNARSVAACYEHGFGTLVSPVSTRSMSVAMESGGIEISVKRSKIDDMSGYTEPLDGLPYVLDNGVWSCHEAGVPWTDEPMRRMVERLGRAAGGNPGWLVLPDIVAGGERSLEHSLAYLDEHRDWLREHVGRVALAVQDGMTPDRVGALIERHGVDVLFVGGSTRWKWRRLRWWTGLGLELGVPVHVGRVNGERRAALCRDLGCASIDGSSITRYAVNAAKMARSCDGDETPRDGPQRRLAFDE